MDLSRSRDLCSACAQACIQTAIHCLVKGAAHPRDQIRLLWDCADICHAGANFLSRGSPLHPEICRACAVVCEACAESCGASDDPILVKCAQTCRECAASCREMAAHRVVAPD